MSTKKQIEVLSFIKKFKEEEGTYPTLHQVANSLGLRSVSTVHVHITNLVKEGKLIKTNEYSGFELPDYEDYDTIPIIGYITAGYPIEAIEEDTEKRVRMTYHAKNGKFYALKVKGDSMIDDGIFDGDTVIIKKQDTAEDGQTVVAVIDVNQTTLKKIYKEKKGYRLQPANQTFLPIFRDEVEIRGIVWEVQRSYTNLEPSNQKISNIKTLDLFAGIGGIRLGFECAGFNTVFANDFDKSCKTTYDLNFKNSKLVIEDVTKISADDLPDFDFILAGFPCQAFSIAGYRKGFEDDKGRGNLFFDIVRFIKKKQPVGFLLENVKNLKSHDNGNTFKVIEESLTQLGYHIKYKVLNSMDYGNVPQNRERIYIVGFKDKNKSEIFEFPSPIKLTKSIKDILDHDVDQKYYYNGKPLFEKLVNDIKEEGKVYQWRRQYIRENKKGVSPTLTANMGMGGHNVPIIFDGKGIRKLTPRECFKLQGFPDSYKLPLNLADSALYKQAGNSVTVSVIERIAKQINKVLLET